MFISRQINPTLKSFGPSFENHDWFLCTPRLPISCGLYATERKRLYCDGLSEAFFVSTVGTHLCYSAVRKTFVSLTYLAGIQHGSGNTRPCIHGLRHTFAMSRMLEWYHCGLPVNDLLPNLSIYMGHTKPACTYWYLTAIPELLTAAGDCFQKFANQGANQ
jgi:integrase/recombinase XerD